MQFLVVFVWREEMFCLCTREHIEGAGLQINYWSRCDSDLRPYEKALCISFGNCLHSKGQKTHMPQRRRWIPIRVECVDTVVLSGGIDDVVFPLARDLN